MHPANCVLVYRCSTHAESSYDTLELHFRASRCYPLLHRNVNRVKTSTLLNTDFEFTAGDPKSEAINNAVTCVNIKVEVRIACALCCSPYKMVSRSATSGALDCVLATLVTLS
jgi:hypothetical protein